MRFHLDVAILSQPIAPPLPNSFELIRNRDFQRLPEPQQSKTIAAIATILAASRHSLSRHTEVFHEPPWAKRRGFQRA
jgi:hypothetical protein